LDIGHVKGFVEVPFPRESHWNKRKGIMEKGFSNGRLERRPSLVNLRRIEPPRGVIAQVVGWENPDPTTKKVLQLGNPTPNVTSM
jgi:hypothetical protein